LERGEDPWPVAAEDMLYHHDNDPAIVDDSTLLPVLLPVLQAVWWPIWRYSRMISQVLSETIVVRDLDSAVAAWSEELGWELGARAAVDPELAEFWVIDPARHPEFAVLLPRGGDRGYLRLVQGETDDLTRCFHAPGFFNAELLCRDVDALHARLSRSPRFEVLCEPTTYDLASTGGACSRSFATRGPGGAGIFFTTYLSVPPPRKLPVCEHLVGPMFNSACAVEEESAMVAFYEGVLGMERRLQGRIASPAINRILDLPADWGFMMVVYKGAGEGLIEVDLHEHQLPAGFGSPAGKLKPGNCFLTLETTDLDAVVARAREAEVLRSPPRKLEQAPYGGRRACVLVGAAGELAEIVEVS